MFYFRPKFTKKPEKTPVNPVENKINPRPKRLIKIPYHFQKNNIITYSQKDIQRELGKYPGLLKTLGHAYEYQIIYTGEDNQQEYWFCRDLPTTTKLLKYLNQQGWNIDWQEKPFAVRGNNL